MAKVKATSESSPTANLEEQLRRLQEIAMLLDAGDLPIEEQLRLYEEGIALANTCRDYLSRAELRIQNLAAGNVSSAT